MPQRAQDWDNRAGKAANAWSDQINKDTHASEQQAKQQDPRKQFEQNVLKQAQGFWNMLQGKSSEDLALPVRYHLNRISGKCRGANIEPVCDSRSYSSDFALQDTWMGVLA